MKITYFHYIYKVPGPLIHMNEFAQAFRELGHEIHVHAMDTEQPPSLGWRVKELLKRPLGRYFHELNTVRKDYSCYWRECRIVKEEKPDLLLDRYHLYHCSASFVARRFGLPLVLWLDAPASYEQRKYLREFFQIPGLAEGIEKYVIKKADQVVAVSEEIKRYLPSDSLPREDIQVVPNGVDPAKFSPLLDRGNIRENFPSRDPVVLGFVGSFSPWHGIESLKSWMAYALSSFENTCFLLVGEGPRRRDLEEFVQAGGWDPRRICFTAQVEHSEVPVHIAAMDICLLPYDQGSEGFYFSPLKLFEYLASGKPVLSAGIGQVQKVVEDGVNGMSFAPASSAEALQKLKELLEDPSLRKRLGAAGRQTILENYTWAHTAKASEKIFNEVLASYRNRHD